MNKVEVRAIIKYFCKKGMSQNEIHDDFIKTLKDESPSCIMVKKWAAEFRRGNESVEDYDRSGRLKEATTDENVDFVHSLIKYNRRRCPRDIARQTGIGFLAVQSILTDILVQGLS